MKLAFALVAAAAASSSSSSFASAFVAPSAFRTPVLRMSTEEASAPPAAAAADDSAAAPTPSVPIVITGNNVEVTPAMSEYVNKKLARTVGKLASSGAVRDCDVHLVINKNPKVKDSHRAEVVTTLKGTVIRCAEDTPDMYASIDAVTDRLARKLKRYKERRLDGWHGGPNVGENLADVLESLPEPDGGEGAADGEGQEFVDPDAPTVTKIKSYDMSKPISLQEAIFALDYVDHDFYVFRNEEDGQINVVYKRNAGGVGLIQPQ